MLTTRYSTIFQTSLLYQTFAFSLGPDSMPMALSFATEKGIPEVMNRKMLVLCDKIIFYEFGKGR